MVVQNIALKNNMDSLRVMPCYCQKSLPILLTNKERHKYGYKNTIHFDIIVACWRCDLCRPLLMLTFPQKDVVIELAPETSPAQ